MPGQVIWLTLDIGHWTSSGESFAQDASLGFTGLANVQDGRQCGSDVRWRGRLRVTAGFKAGAHDDYWNVRVVGIRCAMTRGISRLTQVLKWLLHYHEITTAFGMEAAERA